MSEFIHRNFLLQTEASVRLYHEFAEDLPIIDYHCHLSPRDVAENRQFENLTQIWLAGDHYKWRAMRAAGVSEEYITGTASDWEKFQAWAEVVPKTLRNPLYHWTHLELKRPFGITKLLSPATAKEIWDECNAKLQTPKFTARGIMKQMNVTVVCTTDDPADDLRWHKQLAQAPTVPDFSTKVLPTFRPDKHIAANADSAWLKEQHDYFHTNGCRLSDHGFCEFGFIPELFDIAEWDAEKNWTMQLHIGAIRNNNGRMFAKLGADSGFDSIADHSGYADALSCFFNTLDKDGALPQTVVYNLNPADNEMLCTMLGNFQARTGGAGANPSPLAPRPSKMQFGSGWWFLDQKDGMEKQLNCLSNLGLLSGFVGMLTDSRSFLSYTRHEYFRRILCNLLGSDIEAGLLPRDFDLVGTMVKNICCYNAKNYFGFDVP